LLPAVKNHHANGWSCQCKNFSSFYILYLNSEMISSFPMKIATSQIISADNLFNRIIHLPVVSTLPNPLPVTAKLKNHIHDTPIQANVKTSLSIPVAY